MVVKMKKFGLIIIGAVIGLIITLAGWFFFEKNYKYQGVLIDPPAPAADIKLIDQHGDTFRLSDQHGKVVLIFFGYTNCPDVCPVTLSEYKRIKAALGEQADQVEFVFITVDPERDTQERLKEYLGSFDSDFIGLSGDRQTLEPIWKSYGVYQERRDAGSAAGYLVDHTARTYAIDKQGRWRLNYPFNTEIEILVQDILHLLREG